MIGRHLDLYRYRSANILEIVGGVLVRGLPEGSRSPEALEFLDRDFPQLVATAIAARGEGERRERAKATRMPTGYENFLRALGHWLDQHLAEAVTISELGDFVAVGGVAKVDATGQTTVGPLQWLLREDDTTYMLDEAYRRRALQQKNRSMLGRIAGRRGTG